MAPVSGMPPNETELGAELGTVISESCDQRVRPSTIVTSAGRVLEYALRQVRAGHNRAIDCGLCVGRHNGRSNGCNGRYRQEHSFHLNLHLDLSTYVCSMKSACQKLQPPQAVGLQIVEGGGRLIRTLPLVIAIDAAQPLNVCGVAWAGGDIVKTVYTETIEINEMNKIVFMIRSGLCMSHFDRFTF